MTNTDTRDVEATVKQIHQLEEAGCEIVRLAVVDQEAALAIAKIKAKLTYLSCRYSFRSSVSFKSD